MTDRLQGHEFASNALLKDLYDSALLQIELLAQPHGEGEQYQAMAFTEVGIRQIAEDHAITLGLAVGLGIDFAPEDQSIRLHWRGNDQVSFDMCSVQVDPDGKNYQSFRDVESKTRDANAGLHTKMFDPKRYDNLSDAAANILLDRVENALLETRMGNHKALSYEVVALAAITKAIASADPAQVKAMLCSMDVIDAER